MPEVSLRGELSAEMCAGVESGVMWMAKSIPAEARSGADSGPEIKWRAVTVDLCSFPVAYGETACDVGGAYGVCRAFCFVDGSVYTETAPSVWPVARTGGSEVEKCRESANAGI